MYENRVSQSHDEEEGCVHNDVYTVNPFHLLNMSTKMHEISSTN